MESDLIIRGQEVLEVLLSILDEPDLQAAEVASRLQLARTFLEDVQQLQQPARPSELDRVDDDVREAFLALTASSEPAALVGSDELKQAVEALQLAGDQKRPTSENLCFVLEVVRNAVCFLAEGEDATVGVKR